MAADAAEVRNCCPSKQQTQVLREVEASLDFLEYFGLGILEKIQL
jgi:hypothetical protein